MSTFEYHSYGSEHGHVMMTTLVGRGTGSQRVRVYADLKELVEHLMEHRKARIVICEALIERLAAEQQARKAKAAS